MFTRFSKVLKSTLLFVVSAISLFWIVEGFADSSSNNLNNRLTNVENQQMKKVELKSGSNLVADGEEADKKQIPILMMFSMNHCGYCIQVEEDFLKPMLRNAEYDGKVIMRKIKLDGTQNMRDFNGKTREPGEFSEDYNVSMVPTIVLVDSHGKRLAPSIIGLANAHYYGGELDNAIDASLMRIRALAKK